MRMTRDKFKEFTSTFKGWENHLDNNQNKIISLWLQGDNYSKIAEIMNTNRNQVRTLIHGSNTFNKGSIYRKLISVRKCRN